MSSKKITTAFLILFFPLFLRADFVSSTKKSNQIIKKIETINPGSFSIWKKGIKTRLKTNKKLIALTFDACGGKYGSGYDEKLIQYLVSENVSATLFISGTWINANQETFKKLSQNPLFEIENHGMNHKPCTINGKIAYKIQGTKNAFEMFDEIESNALKIESITGIKPRFYRSGTAHYDSACVNMLSELGYQGVNFDIISDDASPKSPAAKITKNILSAKNGSIVLMHMNQPKWNTLKALKKAIPQLKKLGFQFVKLKDFELK